MFFGFRASGNLEFRSEGLGLRVSGFGFRDVSRFLRLRVCGFAEITSRVGGEAGGRYLWGGGFYEI